jgi:hypothetical protein
MRFRELPCTPESDIAVERLGPALFRLDAAQILDNIDGARWMAAAAAATDVDAGKIAKQAGPDPAAIAHALNAPRVRAVSKALAAK